MKRLLLLVNLHSGKANLADSLGKMISYYNSLDFEVVVYCAQGRGSIEKKIAERGNDFDNIVVCGGDGTLNEAINGLMKLKKQPAFGYVPCGSTNDFANSIGLSTDYEKAWQDAVNGTDFKIDVGLFEERYFSYVAGFGLFTSLSYDTPQNMKNILGYQAYVLNGISELSSIKTYGMRVESDFGVIEDEFILGLVTNSNRVAGFDIPYDMTYNDGLFEVILIKKPDILTAMPIIVSAIIEKNFNNELMYNFRTSKLKFICNGRVTWTIDGENAGTLTETNISVVNEAISLKLGSNLLIK